MTSGKREYPRRIASADALLTVDPVEYKNAFGKILLALKYNLPLLPMIQPVAWADLTK